LFHRKVSCLFSPEFLVVFMYDVYKDAVNRPYVWMTRCVNNALRRMSKGGGYASNLRYMSDTLRKPLI
jgi:hypothetical protein